MPAFTIRPKRHLEIIRKMSISTRDLVVSATEKNKEALIEPIKQAQAQVSSDSQKEAAKKTVLLESGFYPFVKIEPNLVRYYPE